MRVTRYCSESSWSCHSSSDFCIFLGVSVIRVILAWVPRFSGPRPSARSPLLLFLPPFGSGLLGARALRGFRLIFAAGGGAFHGVSRREIPRFLGVRGQEF